MISFPSLPEHGDTYTAEGRTWKYNATYTAWEEMPAAVQVGGDNGWTPVLAVVIDGDRRVLQVLDWAGGEGTKPATGSYVSASGFTDDISLAIDIRGTVGPEGPAGETPTAEDLGATLTPVYGRVRLWDAVYLVAFTSDTQGAKVAEFINGSLETTLDGGPVSFTYDSDGGNWVFTYSAQLESATLPGNADDDPFLLEWSGSQGFGMYGMNITAHDASDVTVSCNGITMTGRVISLSFGTGPTDVPAGNHGHTASQISDSTAAGRALLTAADAAAQRNALSAIASIPAVGSGADAITNMVSLTAAEYAAITPNSTTLYIVT